MSRGASIERFPTSQGPLDKLYPILKKAAKDIDSVSNEEIAELELEGNKMFLYPLPEWSEYRANYERLKRYNGERVAIIEQMKVARQAEFPKESKGYEAKKRQNSTEKHAGVKASPETTSLSIEKLSQNLVAYTKKIEKIIENKDVTKEELKALGTDYTEINTVLRQACSTILDNGIKDGEFFDARNNLISAIGILGVLYTDRMNKDHEFRGDTSKLSPEQEEFKKFFADFEKITGDVARQEFLSGGAFIESFKGENLEGKLSLYKKLLETREGDEETKRAMMTGLLLEEYVLKNENYRVIFDSSGLIRVVTTTYNDEAKSFEKPKGDKDLDRIMSVLKQEDLKKYCLKNVLGNVGISLQNGNVESISYENVVNRLLTKYNIEGDLGQATYNDTEFGNLDSSSVVKSIKDKLANSKSIQEYSDLQFLLDYIYKRKTDYPVNLLKGATELKITADAGYDIGSNVGLDRIKSAFEKGNGAKTILSDIMTANGGMAGVVLIGASIVGLFMGGKWRKMGLGFFGALIGLPAIENLASKWGVNPFVESQKGKENEVKAGNTYERRPATRTIDVMVNGLTREQRETYESLYKENLNRENPKDRLSNQDFAQIYAQLGALNINTPIQQIRDGLKKGDSLESILGGNDKIPQEYIFGLLNINNEDALGDEGHIRKISEDNIRNFLKLISDNPEEGDKTLTDLLVKGTVKTKEYVQGGEGLNDAINSTISKYPLGAPFRIELEKIANELVGEKSNKGKKEKIDNIILRLAGLSDDYLGHPKETADIKQLTEGFNKLLDKLKFEIGLVDTINQIEGNTNKFKDISKHIANTFVGLYARGVGILTTSPKSFPMPDTFDTITINDIVNDEEKIESTKKEVLSYPLLSDEEKKNYVESFDKLLLELKVMRLLALKNNKLDINEVLAELLNLDYDNFKQAIDGMQNSLKELGEPQGSIPDYQELFVRKSKDLAILVSIASISDDALFNIPDINGLIIAGKGLGLRDEAKALCEQYSNEFKANIANDIEKTKAELSGFMGRIEGIASVNELGDFIIEYVTYKENYTSTERINEMFINTGLGDLEVDNDKNVIALMGLIDKTIDDKRQKLETEYLINVIVPSNVENDEEMTIFIEAVKKTRIDIAGYTPEKREEIEKKLDEKIEELISMFILLISDISPSEDGDAKLKIKAIGERYNKIMGDLGWDDNENYEEEYQIMYGGAAYIEYINIVKNTYILDMKNSQVFKNLDKMLSSYVEKEDALEADQEKYMTKILIENGFYNKDVKALVYSGKKWTDVLKLLLIFSDVSIPDNKDLEKEIRDFGALGIKSNLDFLKGDDLKSINVYLDKEGLNYDTILSELFKEEEINS